MLSRIIAHHLCLLALPALVTLPASAESTPQSLPPSPAPADAPQRQMCDIPRGEQVDIHIAAPPSKALDGALADLAAALRNNAGCKVTLHRSPAAREATCTLVLRSSKPRPVSCATLPPDDVWGAVTDVSKDQIGFAAHSPEALADAILSFIEDKLGVTWLTSDCTVSKPVNSVTMPIGSTTYTPPIHWREVYYYEACDPEFARRNKLNGVASASGPSPRNPERYAITREIHKGWGTWCHTCHSLLGKEPAALFAEHPEYFAEIDGKRVAPQESGTQLCWSNPGLVTLLADNLEKAVKAHTTADGEPAPLYWGVNQMDGRGACTCPQCKAADRANGSPIGSILPAINKIAARFPELKIATLAYDYSRKAPSQVKPAPNVVIQLCDIETARRAVNEPIATSPVHASFRQDIVDWGKLCNDIVLWDYVVNFSNLMMPYPDFDILQSNTQFFAAHHVSGIFFQGNREKGGEMAELRTYLLAHLLWDPKCDVTALTQTFLTGYYGAAAPFIGQYLDLTRQQMQAEGKPLGMDQHPAAHKDGYLSEANVRRYEELFRQARDAVRNNPTVLSRVEKESLAPLYVHLRLGYGPADERKKIAAEFRRITCEHHIFMLSEVDNSNYQVGNVERFLRGLGL